MASTAVNVPNPVLAPTSVQLCQLADNVANVIFNQTVQGRMYEDVYTTLGDLAFAIRCLAQSGITVNNTTASSMTSITTRGAFALGAAAAVPATLTTRAV
jgi:hypothetical protein